MHALFAAILLAGAPPPASPPPGAPAGVPELSLPRAGIDLGTLAAPAVLVFGLGLAAYLLRRRRSSPARRVQVLETTSLGPKRALVLARLEDELLLLGTSEAGIHLLRTRPAEEPEEEEPAGRRPPLAAEPPTALRGLVARLRGTRPRAVESPAFEALLAESAEDQELRRKLAHGQAGSVR
ncbi:MAG TPA: flagellar biosynthetic protein FliO [Anaeromyxobacter sp.]|nr:flagellar biosynthetic protein FliO [Anaeromyxobacter sp.]